MEEKSDCENCKTWEEEMYWKHFNSIHFCIILSKYCHDHLVLPEKFSAHMTTELPDKVSLIGPNGTVWDVELLKSDSILFVGDGWKKFAKAYELEENCILMLKYTRNSVFEVLIFDQESFCEKEAAYFVKKCRHSKSELENHNDRIARESSKADGIENDEDDNSAFVVSKKSKKDIEVEEICVGRKNDTGNPRNHTSNTTGKSKGRQRRMVMPCNSLSELQSHSKEMPGVEAAEEVSQILLRVMTSLENGESSPEKHHSEKLKDQCGKNTTGNDTIQELNLISGRDQNTPKNGEDSLEINHSHKMKSLSRMEPGDAGTAKKPSPVSSRELITLDNGEITPVEHSHQPSRKRGRPSKQGVSKCSRKQVSKSDSSGKSYPKEFISNRRAVTEMEKVDALRMAQQEQTENSFIAVMRPTCVYKRFFLSIPAEWINKHLPLRHQEVILRVGDKTWVTGFYYHSKRRSGGICPGWKNFALDNSLEEFDVLLFKLDSLKDNAKVTFDVEIFRVIPKPLPLRVSCTIST